MIKVRKKKARGVLCIEKEVDFSLQAVPLVHVFLYWLMIYSCYFQYGSLSFKLKLDICLLLTNVCVGGHTCTTSTFFLRI